MKKNSLWPIKAMAKACAELLAYPAYIPLQKDSADDLSWANSSFPLLQNLKLSWQVALSLSLSFFFFLFLSVCLFIHPFAPSFVLSISYCLPLSPSLTHTLLRTHTLTHTHQPTWQSAHEVWLQIPQRKNKRRSSLPLPEGFLSAYKTQKSTFYPSPSRLP